GLMWISGKIKSTVMVVACPYDGLPISIEIKRGKTSIESSISNGIPVFTFRVKASGNITEKACITNINDLQVRRAIERALAAAIEKDIQATVTTAQDLGVDFLNLAAALHRQHRNEWHQMSANWPQTFKEAQFKIQVEAKIPQVSLLAKPLVPIKTR
ncbi:MAG: Ger(x)C family spore germination C-terminal domain-containing protein, partial [Methylocystaceae bacterium]